MIGYFYVAQLIPEYNPGRIKVGFAQSVSERMKAHQTTSPYLQVIKSYPCPKQWEKTLIHHLQMRYEFIAEEVLETDNIHKVLECCESFFQERDAEFYMMVEEATAA